MQKQASLQASKLGAIISSASGTIKDVNVEVQKRRPNGYVERLGTGLSDYLDAASDYLTTTDGATLISDLETFAIAQPVAAVAVAAALGFVSA
ncbi:MAG: hypothetical protein IAI50_11390, partial [Candidatus Eremiobacteraeota bacterium]|nr:hypothetical protein [Candidatus Eremiobacteraeota bacterium]